MIKCESRGVFEETQGACGVFRDTRRVTWRAERRVNYRAVSTPHRVIATLGVTT